MNDFTIERCPHDKENPYAQISNALIRDRNVSPRARWFIIYCLSLPRGWKLSIPTVIKEQGLSKDIMYGILKETIKSGYMKRIDRIEGGLKKFTYLISETPKFKECLPCLENPDTGKVAACPGFPDTVNPDTKKERESISTDIDSKKKKDSAAKAAVCEGFTSFGKFVRLKDDEYRTLVTLHGAQFIKDLIDQINDHLSSTGNRPYKDYAATIRNWIRRKKESNFPIAKSEAKSSSNEELAKKIKGLHPLRKDINLGSSYLEFIVGGQMPSIEIKFEDKGFREIAIQQLRKRNLSIEGL